MLPNHRRPPAGLRDQHAARPAAERGVRPTAHRADRAEPRLPGGRARRQAIMTPTSPGLYREGGTRQHPALLGAAHRRPRTWRFLREDRLRSEGRRASAAGRCHQRAHLMDLCGGLPADRPALPRNRGLGVRLHRRRSSGTRSIRRHLLDARLPGQPISDRKQIYAQAFAIYGMAEYFRATGKSREPGARSGSSD
jgi:hypothetical protein